MLSLEETMKSALFYLKQKADDVQLCRIGRWHDANKELPEQNVDIRIHGEYGFINGKYQEYYEKGHEGDENYFHKVFNTAVSDRVFINVGKIIAWRYC